MSNLTLTEQQPAGYSFDIVNGSPANITRRIKVIHQDGKGIGHEQVITVPSTVEEIGEALGLASLKAVDDNLDLRRKLSVAEMKA